MMRGIAKYLTLLFLTALAPIAQAASDDDSVYHWGRWENQVQPAAGGVSPQAQVAPQVQVTGNLSPDQSSQFQAQVTPQPQPQVEPPVVPEPVTPAPGVVPERPGVPPVTQPPPRGGVTPAPGVVLERPGVTPVSTPPLRGGPA